ncbi:bifunctional DNA-formamidopyrimidine glycosylase/DNA-(apurinic or apyrimidinic site) lyase [Patescibacteria group bacterium]|nr:bifunctional DNA-formamidopyrimidine glycosylase/DNA-(apurinic or apyrimidinic site) lyase [Patescibacteria group bacterium]
MPELPEVETIRRGLEDHVVGRAIRSIEVRSPGSFLGDPTQAEGAMITGLERRGKLLIFRLNNDHALTIHLKMTGQLIWKAVEREEELPVEVDNATLPFSSSDPDDPALESDENEVVMGGHPEEAYLEPLPHKHTRVIIRFDDGSVLYFNDLRKFGRVSVLRADQVADLPFLQAIGPEPLERDFTDEYLSNQLDKHKDQPIKTFLLDQANIAGLGNIYADESLFRAAILPDRPAGSLTAGEICNLRDSIQETLELALRAGGSSARDYVNAVGERGTYLKTANVYHRQGLDCNRCNTGKIQRKKIGGRSTHYCPICQK